MSSVLKHRTTLTYFIACHGVRLSVKYIAWRILVSRKVGIITSVIFHKPQATIRVSSTCINIHHYKLTFLTRLFTLQPTLKPPHGSQYRPTHHNTMTSWWARWRLKSPASWLFTQLFIQAQVRENIKAPRLWPFCGEFAGEPWISRTKDQ